MAVAAFRSPLAAACDWNANLNVAASSTHGSGSLTFTWNAITNCNTFDLDHYVIAFNDVSTPGSRTDSTPTIESDGIVFSASSGTTSASKFVHRSQWTYYAKIWACDNSTCSDVYGSGPGENNPTNATDSGATDQEKWILTGVASSATTNKYVALSGSNAPSAFFYPPTSLLWTYTYTYADSLALYTEIGGAIQYQRYSSSGWQNFNDHSFTGTATVAQSHPTNADFDSVGHPYAFPVANGSTEGVSLLAQNHSNPPEDHIVQADATTDVGDDFGLYCAGCCASGAGRCDWPTVGQVAVCADGSLSCDYMEIALHGRWMWNYIDYGPPDMASGGDSPAILFSGETDGTTCAISGDDEIFMATWDGSVPGWVVEMSGSCPKVQITDVHDPGITPLPNDEFKVYVKHWTTGVISIRYYNLLTDTWDTPAGSDPTPKFVYDDSPTYTQMDSDCVANPDSFVFRDGSTPHEGMMFQASPTADPYDGFPCVGGVNAIGVYFAELAN